MASISNSGDAFDRHVAPEYVGKGLEEENLAAARALDLIIKRLSGKVTTLEIIAPATVVEETARRERVIASHGKTREMARRLLQTLIDREQTRKSENAQTAAQMDALTEAAYSLCSELGVGLQEHINSLLKSNAEANNLCTEAQQELNDTKILLKGAQLELEQVRAQSAVDNGSTNRVSEEMRKSSQDISLLLEQRSESREKKSSDQNSELTNLNTLYLIECSARKQADIQVQNLNVRLDAKTSELERIRGDLTKKLAREEHRSEGFEKDLRRLDADKREFENVQSGELTRISELQSKLLEMDSKAKRHEHELTDAISKSKVLEKRIDVLVQELAAKNQEISNLNVSIIDKEATISTPNSGDKQRETELEAQRKDHGTPLCGYPYLAREAFVASNSAYRSPYIGHSLGRNDLQGSDSPSFYDANCSTSETPAWNRAKRSRTLHHDDSEADIEMEDAPPPSQRVTKLAAGLRSSGIGGSATHRSPSPQFHHSLGESMTKSGAGGDSPTRFQFLVSGRPIDGVKTRNVHPQVVQSVERMIEKWNKKKRKAGKWAKWAPVYRCVDVRFGGDNTTRCPPHADTSDWSACQQCMTRKQPCMMVLKDVDPVVLPLPISERPANSTPQDLNYYIKQNVNS